MSISVLLNSKAMDDQRKVQQRSGGEECHLASEDLAREPLAIYSDGCSGWDSYRSGSLEFSVVTAREWEGQSET